jgi:hypothetical protein
MHIILNNLHLLHLTISPFIMYDFTLTFTAYSQVQRNCKKMAGFHFRQALLHIQPYKAKS